MGYEETLESDPAMRSLPFLVIDVGREFVRQMQGQVPFDNLNFFQRFDKFGCVLVRVDFDVNVEDVRQSAHDGLIDEWRGAGSMRWCFDDHVMVSLVLGRELATKAGWGDSWWTGPGS